MHHPTFMTSTIDRRSLNLSVIVLFGMAIPTNAQFEKPLPTWKANEQDVAKLEKESSDSKIKIRPPQKYQKVDLETSPEIAKAGISAYAWTLDGAFPNEKNLSVALGPHADPFSDAINEFVSGMKKSFQRNSESIEFGKVTRGSFLGVEARLGTYTAQISQKNVLGFYLVGIDKVGTFAVSAMIPSSDASPEEIELLKSSMLTFKRVE